MTTLQEFREFVSGLPIEKEASEVPADHVFDSAVLSSKLTEATLLDELDDVTPMLSDDTQEILSKLTYLEKSAFVDDYSKIPTKDRNILKDGIYSKEADEVDQISKEVASKAMLDGAGGNAEEFLQKYKESAKKIQSLKSDGMQKSLYMTGDLNNAYSLDSLHRNYIATCKEFNAEWIWHVAESIGGLKKPKSGSIADINNLNYDEDSIEYKLLDDLEWAEVNKYSDESIKKILKTKEDTIAYTTAKQKWMSDKYGYPLDYVPGSATDEGTAEAMYPFVSAALSVGAAPAKGVQAGYTGLRAAVGNLAGRTNYAVAGALLDAPMTTAVEEVISSDLAKDHPAIALGGTFVSLMLLGPKAEKMMANIPNITKNVAIKSGNTLQQYAKVSKWGKTNIPLSEEAIDLMYTTVRGDYTGTQLSKMMPNAFGGVDDGIELSYLAPQTKYTKSEIEAFELTKDNLGTAQASMFATEQNKFKASIKGDLDRKEFTKAYKEQVEDALANDDYEGALDALGRHIDEANESARNILDTTKEWIPDVDPKFAQRAYVNLLPEGLKETALRNPNALVNQSSAVINTGMVVIKNIRKSLKPHWYSSKAKLKEFNDIIRMGDDGEKSLSMFIDLPGVNPTVKQAVVKYRKLNDKIHKHVDKEFVRRYNELGIKEYRGTHLRVIDEKTGLVEEINTKARYIANMDELTDTKSVLPYSEYFMHRHAKAGTVVLSIVDPVTNVSKAVDSFPTYKAAHEYRVANNITDNNAIHRIGEDVTDIRAGKQYASVVNNATVDNIPDKDKMMDMMHDLGMSVMPDNYDEIFKTWKETYGIKDLNKAKPIIKHLKKGRSREKAFTYGMMEPLESFKPYITMVSRAMMEQPYINKFKTEFFDKFGKYLENSNSYLSKLAIPKSADRTGSMQRAGELLQNQISNMERIPHSDHIKIQKKVDNFLERMYTSESKFKHGVGRLVEGQQKHLPFISGAKSMGYIGSMAFSVKQIPLQASYALFGLAAHGDMFLKNPKFAGKWMKETSALGLSLLADKTGKLGKMIKLSPEMQVLKKEILDGGYVDDLLGTETGSSRGILKSTVDVSMAPVAMGELGNRISNVSLAFRKAASKGLKPGTIEHKRFVSTYYSKYSQVLNHLSNSPLTTSPWTSWNFGMFKKFQLQWFDAYHHGLTNKQKMFVSVPFIAAYGKHGIPAASEAIEAYNMAEEALMPMYIDQVVRGLENVDNLKEEDGIAFIKGRYADNPEVMGREIKRFKEDFKTKGNISEEINNMIIADSIGSDKPLTQLEAMVQVVHNVLNYEGYFNNVAVNVGWASMLENSRTYGKSSMLGPFANNVWKAIGGSPAAKFADVNAVRDEGVSKPLLDGTIAEGRRLMASLFPGPYKRGVEPVIQFGEVIGAINRQELTDESGKPLDFMDIVDDPKLQLDIEFKEQKSGSMGTTVLKDTTSLSDLGWKVLGFESEGVHEARERGKKLMKYYNFVLKPKMKRLADLIVYYDMADKPEMSVALQEKFMSYQANKFGPESPLYDWVSTTLEGEIEKVGWIRTRGGGEYTKIERESNDGLEQRLKSRRY